LPGPGRGVTPTAITTVSSQTAASDDPEREDEVQRRRAAFKVIDGGS
jgi:hypothetical protein